MNNSNLTINLQLCTHTAGNPVSLADFKIFRILGRGAFGAVSAAQKADTHTIFAVRSGCYCNVAGAIVT
jgi:hypothetical protein